MFFKQKYEIYQIFSLRFFPFLVVKFSIYLNATITEHSTLLTPRERALNKLRQTAPRGQRIPETKGKNNNKTTSFSL